MTEWLTCTHCPPDDNEWPPSSFTFAGNAFKKTRCCNDCFTQRYDRVAGHCDVCGGYIKTWRSKANASKRLRHRACDDSLVASVPTFS